MVDDARFNLRLPDFIRRKISERSQTQGTSMVAIIAEIIDNGVNREARIDGADIVTLSMRLKGDVHQRLVAQAKSNNRSVNSEVISLLEAALSRDFAEDPEIQRRQLMATLASIDKARDGLAREQDELEKQRSDVMNALETIR